MRQLLPLLALNVLLGSAPGLRAQSLDVVIRNGHVIDTRNGIDGVRDIGIADGRIAQVAQSIATERGELEIDATGLLVTPGLVDMHAHLFYGTDQYASLSNGPTALAPDGFTLRVGVTTAVDVGGAGWRDFVQFKERVIDTATTRVLSFLNIVGSGMKGGPAEQDLGDMDARLTAMRAAQYPKDIVGIKVAHYQGPDWAPVDRAVEAGKLAGVPVMVDFGNHTPPLSLEALLLEHLRPGDILTHTYAHVTGRTPIVDDSGKLLSFIPSARERGVIFDVGHGAGSFLFRQAVPAVDAGFAPDTISTDLHTASMNRGMKDLLNVASKFLNLGMSESEVVAASTWAPARVIGREDLGHLSVGAEADIAILRLRRGDFGFVDSEGFRLDGDRRLECELTLRAGNVVWDLNGLSRPSWQH